MVSWFNRCAGMRDKQKRPEGRDLIDLLNQNVRWADGKREEYPEYFKRLSA